VSNKKRVWGGGEGWLVKVKTSQDVSTLQEKSSRRKKSLNDGVGLTIKELKRECRRSGRKRKGRYTLHGDSYGRGL